MAGADAAELLLGCADAGVALFLGVEKTEVAPLLGWVMAEAALLFGSDEEAAELDSPVWGCEAEFML